MKYIKTFEDVNEDGWMININDIIDTKIFNIIPDITNEVKKGDIVIGVWFEGDFETYLIKLEELDMDDDDSINLGSCDDDSCYTIDYAWGVFSIEDYKKHDPNIELKINANKYNL